MSIWTEAWSVIPAILSNDTWEMKNAFYSEGMWLFGVVATLVGGVITHLIYKFIPFIERHLKRGISVAAYLMIAARALGFDVGAMSGFANAKVDEAFLKGTTFKSNFLCNIGYADETALFQRLPRFDFDEICQLI